MSKRTRRPKPSAQNLVEWANQYPEAKVTRREIMHILRQLLGPPREEPERPKEIEA